MADYNVKINVKTDTGYDTLKPVTSGSIVEFNNSNTELKSTKTDEAIKEVNTKANQNKKDLKEKVIDKTLSTLSEVLLTKQKGYYVDALAIKELKDLVGMEIVEGSIGEYHTYKAYKFGNGVMILTEYLASSYYNFTAWQTLDVPVGDFPAECRFVDKPNVSVTNASVDGDGFDLLITNVRTVTEQKIKSVGIMSPASKWAFATLNILAIGKWK